MRAAARHEAQLKELWRECFGDSREYIDFFFRNRFAPENTEVWLCEDEAVAMAHLMEAAVDGEKVWYGYAVAVQPEEQGRGIATALQRRVMSERPYIVRPASVELEDFYEHVGLRRTYFARTLWLDAAYGALPAAENCTAARYNALRNARFTGRCDVRWDDAAVDYALRENAFLGGLCLEWPAGAALVLPVGDVLRVRETTLSEEDALRLLPALAARLGCEKVHLTLPESASLGELVCIGMASGLPEDARGYLGLALD